MKLLYRTAEWHGLAKLRMHTDSTLNLLDKLTAEFGKLMRQFRDLTCSKFATIELPREVAARSRRETENRDRVSRTVAVNATAGVQPSITALPVTSNVELRLAVPLGRSPTSEASIPVPAITLNRKLQSSIRVFQPLEQANRTLLFRTTIPIF